MNIRYNSFHGGGNLVSRGKDSYECLECWDLTRPGDLTRPFALHKAPRSLQEGAGICPSCHDSIYPYLSSPTGLHLNGEFTHFLGGACLIWLENNPNHLIFISR